MKTVIIAGGSISDYEALRTECAAADNIICADSGIEQAERIGVTADIWVGDFDSVGSRKHTAGKIVTLPCEKDDTDTMYAARLAVSLGAKEILLFGCIGTRLDHTLANLCVLSFLSEQGIDAKMLDEHNTVFVVQSGGTAELLRRNGVYLSLIPLSSVACGVTVSGVKYPLINAELYSNSTLGVSNEITADRAILSVKKGKVAVFISCD